jgi:hypothetical protein
VESQNDSAIFRHVITHMNHRKLRITWSVAWGMLAALLCLMWVRSNRVCDFFYKRDARGLLTTIGSSDGTLYLVRTSLNTRSTVSMLPLSSYQNSQIESFLAQQAQDSQAAHGWKRGRGEMLVAATSFVWDLTADRERIRFPYWPFVLLCVASCAAPVLPRRFSLRTLLVATTLLAILLGIIYVMR